MTELEGMNEQEKIISEQTNEQRLSDVFAYHRSTDSFTSKSEKKKKIYIAYGSESIHCHAWINTADEIYDFKNILEEDLYASIADYTEEKWDEEHINSIKIFFVKLWASKIAASTQEARVKIIRKYCVRHNIPAPSLIIYDGEEYTLKWILEKSLTKKSIKVWKFIQRKLAEKFLTLLFEDDTNELKYNDALSPYECRYVNYHCKATAILRIPGFLNDDMKQEVTIVDDTKRTYSVREMLLSLRLTKKEIQDYRELKEQCGGYSPKKRNKKIAEISSRAADC